MTGADEMRRCLVDADIVGLQRVWVHLMPHLEPMTDKEALVAMHMARAECKTLTVKMRQYSDRWLRERGFGSGLPDEIKPKGWKVRW